MITFFLFVIVQMLLLEVVLVNSKQIILFLKSKFQSRYILCWKETFCGQTSHWRCKDVTRMLEHSKDVYRMSITFCAYRDRRWCEQVKWQVKFKDRNVKFNQNLDGWTQIMGCEIFSIKEWRKKSFKIVGHVLKFSQISASMFL